MDNTEHRCDTCRHSIGYTKPEYVVCHADLILPRIKPRDFCCGSWEREPGTDAKEREE